MKDLQKLNLKTLRAYLLKEAFRPFWKCRSVQAARRFLDQWLWMATHSRLVPLRNFARMVRSHIEGILSYFRYHITNGVVEALCG